MSAASAIRSWLSAQPRGDELRPTGPLDRLAGSLLLLAAFFYLFLDTFGAVLRWGLSTIGLTALIYLPAAVGIPALLVNMLARTGDPRTATPMLTVVGIIVGELILALMLGRQLAAAAFGLYICVPALLMMALVQRRMQDRVIDLLIPIFFVAMLGVFVNSFMPFPWEGMSYEVFGTEVSASREWWTQGKTRLGGFSRASFTVSAQILIGYCALEYRLKSLLWRSIWWVVGLGAIYLTTSKSPQLAMALLPATYFVIGRTRSTDAARRRMLAALWMLVWVVLIFTGPFLSMTVGQQLYPEGPGVGRSYDSLADRVLTTWPNAIAMIDWHNPATLLVGHGLGGIGTPSMMFAPPGNPGDNLAIYLYVMLGVVSFVIAYLIFRGGQRAIASSGRGRRDFAMIIAMLGVGTAANVVEMVVPLMVLGLAIARYAPTARAPGATQGGPVRRRRRAHREPVVGEAAVARES